MTKKIFLITILFHLTYFLPFIFGDELEVSFQKDASLLILAFPLNSYVQNEFRNLRPVENIHEPSDTPVLLGKWSQKQYSSKMQLGGSLLLGSSFLSPLVLSTKIAWAQARPGPFFTESLIYLEALAYSSMFNIWIRSMPLRARPLVYNSDAPPESRTKFEASSSFYSGHASAAFLTATYSTFLFNMHYPKSAKSAYFSAGAYSIATLVALSRLYGGNHYATDLVVGAMVGSLFGYLFPYFHRNSHKSPPLTFNLNSEKIAVNLHF